MSQRPSQEEMDYRYQWWSENPDATAARWRDKQAGRGWYDHNNEPTEYAKAWMRENREAPRGTGIGHMSFGTQFMLGVFLVGIPLLILVGLSPKTGGPGYGSPYSGYSPGEYAVQQSYVPLPSQPNPYQQQQQQQQYGYQYQQAPVYRQGGYGGW